MHIHHSDLYTFGKLAEKICGSYRNDYICKDNIPHSRVQDTELTDPQRIPSPLSSTHFLHTLKITTPKYNTLQLDIGVPHKQTRDSLDWWSHLFHSSAQHRSPPRAVCSAPSYSCCTPMTAPPYMERTLLGSL